MSILGKIFGAGVAEVVGGVKDVASIFTENKEEGAKRSHENDISARNQFAKEFAVHTKRTMFDSFVDGVNRLVRPLLAYSVFTFFAIAIYDYDRMLRVTQSLVLVPEGVWILFGIVLTFYFGGRMQTKSSDLVITKTQIEAAERIEKIRTSNSKEKEEEEYRRVLHDESEYMPNKYIEEWNRRNQKEP